VDIPIPETTSTSFSFAGIENKPSADVDVPAEFPFTMTLAPETGSPVEEDSTFPLILSCAEASKAINATISMAGKRIDSNFLLINFRFVFYAANV
jgi:hypothetical protein